MVKAHELLVESDNENVKGNMIIVDNANFGGDYLIVLAVDMKFKDEKGSLQLL